MPEGKMNTEQSIDAVRQRAARTTVEIEDIHVEIYKPMTGENRPDEYYKVMAALDDYRNKVIEDIEAADAARQKAENEQKK